MNIRIVDARCGWRWIVAGIQMFRRAPAQWLLLIGTLFVASRLLFLLPLAPLAAAPAPRARRLGRRCLGRGDGAGGR